MGLAPAGYLRRVSVDEEPMVASPGWVAPVFAAGAVLLVPWVGYLAVILPVTARVNSRLPWVGFDLGLMCALAATALLAWRGSPRIVASAICTATMLVVDAWFDVTSAVRGTDLAQALVLSVLELSVAAACVWIAHHADLVMRNNIRSMIRRRTVRAHPRGDHAPEWRED